MANPYHKSPVDRPSRRPDSPKPKPKAKGSSEPGTLGTLGSATKPPKRKQSGRGRDLRSYFPSMDHGGPEASASASASASTSTLTSTAYREWVPPPSYPAGQREALRATAQETLAVLPALLQERRATEAAQAAQKLTADVLPRLSPQRCPRFARAATIRVRNEDTLNAALALAAQAAPGEPPPLLVNFASHRSPGGGWRNGAMAQEEALCYRSSLALSLHRRLYPLGRDELLYSGYVLVVRGDRPSGHRLLAPERMAVVSAVTVAALRSPEVRQLEGGLGPGSPGLGSPRSPRSPRSPGSWSCFSRDSDEEQSPRPSRPSSRLSSRPSSRPSQPSQPSRPSSQDPPGQLVFAHDRDRDATKAKMRLTLRTAAAHGHTRLVLGALGCGVFGNPAEDVAHCWLEVLHEAEFAGTGHWWREIVFAVYAGGRDSGSNRPRDDSNYGIFHRVLNGRQV